MGRRRMSCRRPKARKFSNVIPTRRLCSDSIVYSGAHGALVRAAFLANKARWRSQAVHGRSCGFGTAAEGGLRREVLAVAPSLSLSPPAPRGQVVSGPVCRVWRAYLAYPRLVEVPRWARWDEWEVWDEWDVCGGVAESSVGLIRLALNLRSLFFALRTTDAGRTTGAGCE
jgi:hypothetical protein